jgi:hypothetical protein
LGKVTYCSDGVNPGLSGLEGKSNMWAPSFTHKLLTTNLTLPAAIFVLAISPALLSPHLFWFAAAANAALYLAIHIRSIF